MPLIARLADRYRQSFADIRFVSWRFASDDSGQDLVEYGLLAAFIGIAGWLALMGIDEAVGTTYTSWLNPDSGVPSLWAPPEPPAGAGS